MGTYHWYGVGDRYMAGYTREWRLLCESVRARMTSDPTCWLCGHRIDLMLDARDPWSLTFDHVVPRAEGGEDREDNMLPAHRACNTSRMHEWRKSKDSVNELRIKNSRTW